MAPVNRPWGRVLLITLLALLVVLAAAAIGGLLGLWPWARQAAEAPSGMAPEGEYVSGPRTALQQVDKAAGEADTTTGVERKVVQTMVATLEVPDIQAALDGLAGLAGRLGGYVVSSTFNAGEPGTPRSAAITIKVPHDRLAQAAKALEEMGTVRSRSLQTTDVTMEYYDVQARLAVMRKTEERLLSFMERADKVADLIALEAELSRVRSEIESLQARVNYLSSITDYSELTVQLLEVPRGQLVTPTGTWARAWAALVASVNTIAAGAAWLFVAAWWLLPYLAIAGLAFLAWRWRRRRTRRSA